MQSGSCSHCKMKKRFPEFQVKIRKVGSHLLYLFEHRLTYFSAKVRPKNHGSTYNRNQTFALPSTHFFTCNAYKLRSTYFLARVRPNIKDRFITVTKLTPCLTVAFLSAMPQNRGRPIIEVTATHWLLYPRLIM